ncbi:hypothetical protein BDR22DRAFT_498320 [Usnea florida]
MMHSFSYISVVGVLQILLGFSCANALGLNVSTSLDGQLNTTLNVPAAFKVSISSDSAHPIDATAFYMNGIELFYRLSAYNRATTWGRTSVDLESYGLKISLESPSPSDPTLSSQYIIWGLSYVAFSMAVTGKYEALTATLKWDGRLVGSMRVNNTAQSIQGGGLQLVQSGGLQNGTSANDSALLPSATGIEADKEDVDISWVYSSHMIDRNDVFLTTLRAVGDAIERGVDDICVSQLTYGIRKCVWVLNSERGPDGVYLLRYRHAILAIRKVINQMVKDDRFSGILINVALNTISAGNGGFQRLRTIDSAAVQ